MTTAHRNTPFVFALGILLAVLLPSSNLARLDGLPLASLAEVIVLLLILPLVFWREVREAAWGLVSRRPIGRALAWALLGVILASKAALLVAGPVQGWPGCYRAGIAPIARYSGPIETPDCERSFDNPFNRGVVTRFDRTIVFSGDTWNLGFFNSTRFDFYDWLPDMPLRARLPFEAIWSGAFILQMAETIRVEYVGEGELQMDGGETVLAPSYAEAAAHEIPLAAGLHAMQLHYRFDDGSRSGQDPDTWGPLATLRVVAVDGGAPLSATPPRAALWPAVALMADVGLGLLALVCLLALAQLARRELIVPALMLAAAAGLGLLPASRVEYVERVFGGLPLLQVSFAGLAVLLLVVHLRWRRLLPVTLYLGLAVLSLAIMRHAYSSWDYVSIRSAGNDTLIAESQARTILETGSLQGEEAVFYYQPLYRYLKFGEHALFGEGDVLYGAVALVAGMGGAFFALERFRPTRLNGTPSLLWILAALSLLGLTGYYVARYVRDGLSEYPTWIAMLWAFPLLYAPPRTPNLLLGGLLLGMASITRTNQIPGNGLVLLVSLMWLGPRTWKARVPALAVFGGVCLLPLVHNLVFGGAFVLTTTSAGVPANLIFGPREWLGVLRGAPEALSVLGRQTRLLLFATPLEDWQAPVGVLAHVVMGTWLASVGWVWTHRETRSHWELLLPLPYLMTIWAFDLRTYYPRHVMIGVLVTALAVLAALGASAGEAYASLRPESLRSTHDPAARMG